MASLERDPASGKYHVRFRRGGRVFRRSLRTGDVKLARARAGRIAETLHLLQHGRLVFAAGADAMALQRADVAPRNVLVTLHRLGSTPVRRRMLDVALLIAEARSRLMLRTLLTKTPASNWR